MPEYHSHHEHIHHLFVVSSMETTLAKRGNMASFDVSCSFFRRMYRLSYVSSENLYIHNHPRPLAASYRLSTTER